MSDDLIGKQIGGYEILARIGQGGMATVYRARQTSMNRTVALKVLPRHLLRDETYLQRFEREVRIVAQLEHRNIVPVHDYGEHDSQPYIAMRYMPAGSVDDLLSEGPIPPEKVLSIIEQVAPALDYAHARNVLHRDLKPSNILMDDDGGAYLTDFGIARLVDTDTEGITLTSQGVIGTPSYMSPEQAQGHALDGRSDIYSLGITLYEMLTARRPFVNDTPYSIAVMQVTTPPPAPRTINPSLTLAIEQVILKALKKRPENRYQTAVELAEALRMAIERPDSLFDTQPANVIAPESAQYTQPSAAQQGMPQNTTPSEQLPSVPPLIPPPRYSAPPSQSIPPANARSQVRRSRAKRPGNFWLSVIVGSVIGCGLLSAVVVVAVMVFNNLFQDASALPTPNPTATLDPTSEAARQALLNIPGVAGSGPDETPVFIFATPIPTRTPAGTPEPDIPPVGLPATATLDPELAPDPGQLIYFDYRNATYNLYRYDLRTGIETRLTDDPPANTYPQISPDGTQVVFQSNRNGRFNIYIMDLNTLQTRRITDTAGRDRMPSWSADGQWIVFASDTRDDGSYDIYRVRANGSSQPELIFSDGRRNSHPRFSPDGQSIVFTGGEPGNATTWEIMHLDLLTGELTALTDNDVRDAFPSFTPDGEQIIYVTDGDSGAAIALMNVDGSDSHIIHDDGGFEWGMSYSPDEQFIVFSSQYGERGTIYLMRHDGSGLRRIENASGFYLSWRPAP